MQNRPVRIAVDVMGGDHAPQAPVAGVLRAASGLPDTEFVLVGDKALIMKTIGSLPERVAVRHTTEVIESGAEPVRSVRRLRDSSLVVCTHMIRDGEADAMVSAGNTGAFLVAGLLVLGRMPGIERPALAAFLPTFRGNGAILLDAGANTDCTPDHLVQFAAMGRAYMHLARGCARPRVGLLNIGAEEQKGNELTKAAYPLLKERFEDFVGNVEARDVLQGTCDVVVCEGFVGNVLVKFYEGVGVGLLDAIKGLFYESWVTKLAALPLRKGLRAFRKRFDYAEYGGGPFLGVRGVLVKAHGSSNAHAFEMALRQARTMKVSGLVAAIEQELGGSSPKRG